MVQGLPQMVIPLSSLAVDTIIDWLIGYDGRAFHDLLDLQKDFVPLLS